MAIRRLLENRRSQNPTEARVAALLAAAAASLRYWRSRSGSRLGTLRITASPTTTAT